MAAYLCRCPSGRRGWPRSCTPVPWCGRRAAIGCSPRSVAWRRPCSSRSRPVPAPRPGRTAARPPGTGTRRGRVSPEPAERSGASGERREPSGATRPASSPSLSRTAARPAALTRRARQRRAAARAGRVPAEPMSSAGAAGAVLEQKRERGRRGLRRRRAPPPYIGRGAAAALTSRVPAAAESSARGIPGMRLARAAAAPPRPVSRHRRCRGGSRPGRAARGARSPLPVTRGLRPVPRTEQRQGVTRGRAGGAPRSATCAGSGGGAPRPAVSARDCPAL